MQKKLNKKKITVFILVIICGCFLLSFAIYSYAKYVVKDSEKALVIPSNFQFSSNYLKENNPVYNVYDLSDGITIKLYNSVNINKSEIDVPYNVTVTNGTSNVQSGIITTSEDEDEIIITPTNTDNPMIVSVSSNTYNYTLTATFNFVLTENEAYYTFIDKGNYSELVIKTSSNTLNSLSVNWNSNYVPDNTNLLMENWTGTAGSLSLSANTEYKFIFFKKTNTAYSNITNTIIQNNVITLP